MQKQKLVKCVVACYNASGEPDFYPRNILCTEEQYNNGDHYEEAKSAAKVACYSGPMVCFDENDHKGFLFDHFMWMNVLTDTVPKGK